MQPIPKYKARRYAVLCAIVALALSCSSSQLSYSYWNPYARDALVKVVTENGNRGALYTAASRPYIVLDWDNTSIMNDCAANLFVYQIDRLAYKLTPAEFSRVIRTGIPNLYRHFAGRHRTVNGAVITPHQVFSDLDAHYLKLTQMMKTMEPGELKLTDVFQDFKAKMIFLYYALDDTFGADISYKWTMYLFVNYTPDELVQIATQSHIYNLDRPLSIITFTSPPDMRTRAGGVSAIHRQGVRIQLGILDLVQLCKKHGIDVYVCTASLEDIVAAFACNPLFEYDIPRDNVIGMRLATRDGRYIPSYQPNYAFNYRKGKRENVSELIAKTRGGRGPLIVGGDSDGDWEMLSGFGDTRAGLILNKFRDGSGIAVGSFNAARSQQMKDPAPRYLLQGRNENTGEWVPRMEVLLLGEENSEENYKLIQLPKK